ncbi:N-acetylglucosamine 6-phosphate deacetylase [Arachidicoccus rhizosphaerae]|uniref:N-acetylglucosamine 6-phosphate deacetylase n=1 Tax=Arachidicoccus rhizosphaerae TaxID=551991 RepID=A0A1H3ZLM6_9BACT|nr:N-acetylglucosamine-6-phosphate deacetylase [Arachidicoccus rhizosphaerae]SEA24580.1 N-acetylglucosamine 6-phosphate deacetylase [Arachidicoccus rhizosphaerae]
MTQKINSAGKPVLITHALIHTGSGRLDSIIEDGAILIKNGKIQEVFASGSLPFTSDNTEIIDLQGRRLAPALVDIQINGGYQRYFSKDPDEATLLDITRSCHDYGTLHFLPTLISSPTKVIIQAIGAIRAFKEKYPEAGVLGMHLEGPFFNPVKRGAHSASIVRKPTDQELETIVKEGRDIIKVMTLAPEMFTDDQLRFLMDQGILLSAGHSDMSYEQAMHYFDLGINLVTHLYNAMSGFSPRTPGFSGAALERKGVWAPIILDGHHVHYGAARLAHQAKGEQLFLITDSSFLGRRVREFTWADFDAKMTDGTYRNKEGNLAGAAISMVEALQNALNHLPVTEPQALAMATSRPAKALGLDRQVGYIAPGYPARFCVYDAGFNNLEPLVV